MLLEGEYDDARIGPVVDIAIGASREWTYRKDYRLSWVRGAFNRDQEHTSIRRDTRYDLGLREKDGLLKVLLLFREKHIGRPVLFRDVEVDEIDTFSNLRHRELLKHDPEIRVVLGRNVLGYCDLVMFPGDDERRGGKFLLSVDTGTGITPVARSC